MLRPQIEINITGSSGVHTFTYVSDVTITESRDSFTRTATIVLPQRYFTRNQRVFDVMKIEDKVTIDIGYFPNLIRRFNGYITKRDPNSPLVLKCEDESWIHKNLFVEPVTLEATTLDDLIAATYTGKVGKISKGDRKIGDWRIKELSTFTTILETLKSKFGILSFWDIDGALIIDPQLETTNIALTGLAVPRFSYAKNLISTDSMDYQEAAEYSQIVYGTSFQEGLKEDGSPLDAVTVYSFYDRATGTIQSTPEKLKLQGNVNRFNIPYLSYDDLKALTESRLESLNFTGFRGTFLTFGEPVVKINEDCRIENNRIPEMSGRYRVKGVTIRFNTSAGYKQDIEIARQII